MRYLPWLLILFGLPVMAASVWKWRDTEGVVHYSDQPVPGAEQISTQAGNTYSGGQPTGRGSTTATPAAAAPANYSNVEIWKPSNEATITGSGGSVDMAARVEPQLAPGHRLALYLDGKLVEGYPPQATSYTLNDVERGQHSLTLVVSDAQGKRVASSGSVTFYVQQPTVLKRR